MVEARVVTLENLFTTNKVTGTAKFSSILSEEQGWADKANREREEYIKEQEKNQKIAKIIFMLYIAVTVILSIVFICILIKNIIKASKIKKKKMLKLDYFRDIPDKEASAGEAAFLYYFKKGKFNNNISKILSATMLQLSLKKYIAFYEDNTKSKPQVRVNILNNTKETENLTGDEQAVYELLKKVSKENTFTMKEFEKYAKKNCESFMNKITSIEKKVKAQQIENKNYSKEIEKEASKHIGVAIVYLSFGVFSMFFLLIIPGILILLNSIPHFVMYNKIHNLTDKGLEEKAKWMGLKKYMEDFSLLNEKEVPDLKLWEKYLVFATAFGIADKVLKQLKIKYPELQNIDGYDDYAYMYMLYHSSLNTRFINSLNTSVNKVYMGGMSAQAAKNYDGSNFSSGGGFGGGFSGSGGGRRRRRPEWVADRKTDKKSSHYGYF